MALTADQEALIDSTGNVVNAFVYIHTPELIFEAPLVDVVSRAKAYVSLEYGTPTVGSIDDVRPEMTLEIDIDGRADGGRQRVRGKDSDNNLIHIGRTSPGRSDGRLVVTQGGTIRIYKDFRPFIKAPFISKDGLTQYKDEQTYPGDDEAQPPVASIGPDRLIITNAASAEIDFNALGAMPTFAVRSGASIASYLWDVDDGTITDGTDTSSAITVSFPRGARWITLRVIDSNGVSHRTWRLIVVARPEDCIPAEITTYTSSPAGTTMSILVDADRIPDDLPTGAKVIVSERENYSLTNIIDFAERFSGWIGEESGELVNAKSGYSAVRMELYDVGAFLRRNNLFPQSINIADGTGGWYELADANIDRLMHHLIHWHTNVLNIAGFKWSGEGATYPFSELTTAGGTFWSDLEKLAHAFAHVLTVDARGQIRVLPDPHIQPTADQAAEYVLPTERPTGVVTTFSEDRYTTFDIAARKTPDVYWYKVTALLAAETINDVVSAIAPANAPGLGTSSQSRVDYLVTSQDELNVWAGNEFAAKYGNTIDNLRIEVLNPAFIVDPAKREFVAVVLPGWIKDRYNLFDDDNRWTVESIAFSYEKKYKRATYTLKKEVVASDPARKTSQADDGDTVQVWDGFDDSISPTTGAIVREFEGGMVDALTQPQLEESLRKTWLKIYVGPGSVGDDGNVTGGDGGDGGDGDGDSSIGAGTLAEQAERNGGFYEVARRLSDFWSKTATVWAGIEDDADEQARFEQYVKASIIETSDAAVTAWWTYVTTVDDTFPSLSLSERESITSYMYCAINTRAGITDYILSLSSTVWDRWFTALDAISDEQLDQWYEAGTATPVNFFSGYACYLYPPEELTLNTTQIHDSDVIQGQAMNWETRKGGTGSSPTGGSFVYVQASGSYEDADYIKDAFYVYDKTTGEVSLSPLRMGVAYYRDNGGLPDVPLQRDFTFTTPPPYSESHNYAATGRLPQESTSGAFDIFWTSTRYDLADLRSPSGTGTGSFEVTFTDLGKI